MNKEEMVSRLKEIGMRCLFILVLLFGPFLEATGEAIIFSMFVYFFARKYLSWNLFWIVWSIALLWSVLKLAFPYILAWYRSVSRRDKSESLNDFDELERDLEELELDEEDENDDEDEEEEEGGDTDFDLEGKPINRIREIIQEDGEVKEIVFRDFSSHQLSTSNQFKATIDEVSDLFGMPRLISYSAYGGKRLYQNRWDVQIDIDGMQQRAIIENARDINGDHIQDLWTISSANEEVERGIKALIEKQLRHGRTK